MGYSIATVTFLLKIYGLNLITRKPDKPKLRDILQNINNWTIIFKSVKVMKPRKETIDR